MCDNPDPCPFCGGKAEVIPGMYKTYSVCCPYSKGGCGAHTASRKKRQAAIDVWNRRAFPSLDEATLHFPDDRGRAGDPSIPHPRVTGPGEAFSVAVVKSVNIGHLVRLAIKFGHAPNRESKDA